ncbi:helicase, putative [Eimeria maxima]|uniref:Helicase, putative n=1 Tax=Eimeria maxima TaxID=5804 RepID=U6M6R8_EIMMA|nr:helicase, putative [Eimeria maxima]CDJ59922.1 helicase, putative [Eimeria maxima]
MKDTGQRLATTTVSSTCSAAQAAAASEEHDTFGFPYVPYLSQLRFMDTVWRALQGSSQGTKFAALEMATGGGKTLSFLCPSVLWLKQQAEQLILQQLQQKHRQIQAQQKQQQDSEKTRKTPPWVKTALLQQQRQQAQQFLRERKTRLKEAAARSDAAAAANPMQHVEQQKGQNCKVALASKRLATVNSTQEQQDLAEYDAYAPEEPDSCLNVKWNNSLHESWGTSSQPGSSHSLRIPQIVICSRTHQQLQQYVSEIRMMQEKGRREEIKDFVAVVAAGRQQLCLHPDVFTGDSSSSNSNSSSDLGDKCSYLVSKGLCGYYKRKHLVSDAAVAATLDIEDLRRIGRSVGGCPYYGCRAAAAEADVVLLPFSLAFPADGSTAEVGFFSLADSVFCVDEAHHLSAALSNSKSATLSHRTTASAARLLSLYVKQFSSRLAPRSLHLLQQLTRLVETIYKGLQPYCCCGEPQEWTRQQQQQQCHVVDDSHSNPHAALAYSREAAKEDTKGAAIGAAAADIQARGTETVLTATALLRLFKLDSFDFHELIAFLSDPTRRICQKMRGFAMQHNHKLQQPPQKQQQTKQPQTQQKQQRHTEQHILEPSCMYTVRSFIHSLLGMDAADRLVITSLQHHQEAASTVMGLAGAAERKTEDGMGAKLACGRACCCCRLEVVCLATEKAFEPILKTARLVVLMGGTLSPFESLTRFVRCLPPSSYMFLSADTGTASDRVLALPISRLSSSCSDFCFEFSQRIHFPMQFVSLLRLLLCVSGTVSGGVVVFFPSFATLQSFLAVAGISDGDAGRDVAASAAAAPIMTELKKLGPIFAERRAPGPTKVDAGIHIAYGAALWQIYTCAILKGYSVGRTLDADKTEWKRNSDSVCGGRNSRDNHWQSMKYKAECAQEGTPKPRPAFLFCVMGGRLSEGVNFSDALARLLVVVGMPFPCIKDKIFTLHREHYNEIMQKQQATADEAKEARPVPSCGLAYSRQQQQQQQQKEYQCLDYGLLQCMTTVNQTIGRAIRHSKDYAAILLVDRRYSLARVQQLLPRWVVQSLEMPSPTQDNKCRADLTAGSVTDGAEAADEFLTRRLESFFGRLEKAEHAGPK